MELRNHQYAITKKTVAPIRKETNFKSEMADESLFGMVVKILRNEGRGWYYVETHYDYYGYMHESDLIMDTDEALDWQEKSSNNLKHPIIDVMAEAKYQSYKIELLVKGSFIIPTDNKKDGWTEIILPQKKKGWIKSDFIYEDNIYVKDEDKLRERLVKTALTYLGTQYRWGGKSPLGIDCSGLTSMSYLLNGIVIYRDALLKDKYMKEIKLDDIKKGDLLFFPGHVAMYIGDNKYVHSTSSSHGVVINSLDPEDKDFRKDLKEDITCIGTIF
ncbi:MAG: NlpC/P60 family protein [Firmicutes bacterium]|nr:NlpC/P60 family protein [Bacillota bacterium]